MASQRTALPKTNQLSHPRTAQPKIRPTTSRRLTVSQRALPRTHEQLVDDLLVSQRTAQPRANKPAIDEFPWAVIIIDQIHSSHPRVGQDPH